MMQPSARSRTAEKGINGILFSASPLTFGDVGGGTTSVYHRHLPASKGAQFQPFSRQIATFRTAANATHAARGARHHPAIQSSRLNARVVQIGPNTQFGGLNEGLTSPAYHGARFGNVAIWPTSDAATTTITARAAN